MRYTIRGRRATIARRDVRTYGLTRAGSWRIDCLAARLERARPVHRERVRFGAWEARPRVEVGDLPEWIVADLTPFREAMDRVCQIYAETWPALAALAGSGATVGTGEGPGDSGRSQTYKCEEVR